MSFELSACGPCQQPGLGHAVPCTLFFPPSPCTSLQREQETTPLVLQPSIEVTQGLTLSLQPSPAFSLSSPCHPPSFALQCCGYLTVVAPPHTNCTACVFLFIFNVLRPEAKPWHTLQSFRDSTQLWLVDKFFYFFASPRPPPPLLPDGQGPTKGEEGGQGTWPPGPLFADASVLTGSCLLPFSAELALGRPVSFGEVIVSSQESCICLQ